MTKAAVKQEMSQDAKLAKTKILLSRAGVDVDKTMKKLVDTYGLNAYDIVVSSMVRPSAVMQSLGEKPTTSKKTIEYIANSKVPPAKLAKALGKSETEIKQNTAYRGTKLQGVSKVQQKNEAKRQKTENSIQRKYPRKDINDIMTLSPVSTRVTKPIVEKPRGTSPQKPVRQTAKKQAKSPAKQKSASPKSTPVVKGITPIYAFNFPDNKNAQTLPWMQQKQKTPEEKAQSDYEKIRGAHMAEDVSIADLMKNGVTQEDIQAVFRKNPETIEAIKAGPTGKNLAKRAAGVKGNCAGNCLSGVQTIHSGITTDSDTKRADKDVLSGQNPDWPAKVTGSPYNSACNTYKVLEKSGQYLTLTYPNKAYGKTESSAENQAMKDFNKKIPMGTTVCTDNNIPDGYRGRVDGLGLSAIHGHVWVIDTKGNSCSDGVQPDGPNFTRYGKNMHISIPKDCTVTKDFALEILKQKNARLQQQQKQVAQKQAGR